MSTLDPSRAFHGFAVPDVADAKAFYADVLGVDVREEGGMLQLHLGGGTPTLVYPKPNHEPAGFTVLNFPVTEIEVAVDELAARGVVFEHYEGTPMETDATGVFRGGGPLIAWFTDPGGNVCSVIEAPGA
jgi:catechol 2,3-dioxygenase-like lactoylglutathione lyase family enzyme